MPTSFRPDPRTLIPLSPTTLYILLALAEGDRHGYSIIKEVDASTGGTVKLFPGTLYRLIKQMVLDGWIVEEERNDPSDDQRRRYYRLTKWGRAIAQAESQRLLDVVRLAQTRKLLGAII
jgi:DNA-binding PadR family transcriptional regulator